MSTSLPDAYGDTDEVPQLLEQLTPGPDTEVWSELWGRICHQGTVYPVSFAAIPQLTRAAASWPPASRVDPLTLAGGIFAGDRQSPEFAPMRERYAEELATLRRLTAETLTTEMDEVDFVYLLEAAMAFDDIRPWATELDRLTTGEVEATCPACGAELLVSVDGDYGFFTADGDYVLHPEVRRGALQPAAPESLSGVGRRLYDAAHAAGHATTADQLRHLFGEAACARCGARFPLAERVEEG